jgi:hypothetical protein
MTSKDTPDADSAGVPAGFTYLGQFVDHDLTKDVTDAAFGSLESVAELRQGRSPASTRCTGVVRVVARPPLLCP